MNNFLVGLFSLFLLFSCNTVTKQQNDKLYSRHLQRKVALTIISTPLPEKKGKMNLLLCNNPELLDDMRAKKIIDSLFTKKLIQPIILVAFEGNKEDYGLQEANGIASKQYRKFNVFVRDELYPYIKNKVAIRKFKTVAICGFGQSAISAFDIAWNTEEKIQKIGMFLPTPIEENETISTLRKRPSLQIWITDDGRYDSSIIKLYETIKERNSTTNATLIKLSPKANKHAEDEYNFADFLLWAFPYQSIQPL